MKYTEYNLIKDILKILKQCDVILEARLNGICGEATVDQIKKTVIPEMNDLLYKIEKGTVPEKPEDRWIISCANITRGWNWDIRKNGNIDAMSKKLGRMLCRLDQNYKYNFIKTKK